jgi:hypothetical protein
MAGFVTRFGTAFGVAALGASLAAIPAAIRIGAADAPACGTMNAWMVLAGVGVGPMLAAIVVLRGARVGLKAFGGPGADTRLAAFVLWAFLLLGSLIALGALLRATTHHHALAGVTFAIGAVVVALALALVALRLGAMVSPLTPGTRRVLYAAGAAVLLGLCTFVANRFRAGGSLGTGLLGVSIVDFLAFGIVATFGSRPELVERRLLALLGPPAVATLLVVGISAFRACPPMLEATKGHAPLYSRVLVELSPD